jgi:hypothetical protein
MAQVEKCLPRKCEVLSTFKKEKKQNKTNKVGKRTID